jgi:hypothetical protein
LVKVESRARELAPSLLHLDVTFARPTATYLRGRELRDALYGPITPATLDEHLKRYTRASGEFELAFGREPMAGDILHYEHLKLMHSAQNYSREFGRVIEACMSRVNVRSSR